MSLMRTAILKASANPWCENAPRYGFLRRTVTRFMPGRLTTPLQQLASSPKTHRHTVTQLGESIENRAEAESVAITILTC
jgi:hypothetical protein